MKSLIPLLVLLGALVLTLYLCKKMGIDVNAILGNSTGNQNNQPNLQAAQPQTLAKGYNVQYQTFANLVWNCLQAIGRICGVDCPDMVSRIYCAQMGDRVRATNGRIDFFFEVPVETNTVMRNGELTTLKSDRTKIKQALNDNLPDYMDGGCGYTGDVYVWEIDENRVRIEVQGVYVA